MRTHFWHAGRCSSHFTLRALQTRHPVRTRNLRFRGSDGEVSCCSETGVLLSPEGEEASSRVLLSLMYVLAIAGRRLEECQLFRIYTFARKEHGYKDKKDIGSQDDALAVKDGQVERMEASDGLGPHDAGLACLGAPRGRCFKPTEMYPMPETGGEMKFVFGLDLRKGSACCTS